jgi:hypothetical protein
MRCTCGSEIKEFWKFCKECGRSIEREEKIDTALPREEISSKVEKEREEIHEPISIASMREEGRAPYSTNGKQHLFFLVDREQDYIFDFRKHLELFKTMMPPMLDEYYVKTDMSEMEKSKPYGKTELLGHERILSYEKKWGAQEYMLRILFNLIYGRFSYYGTKTIKMKKPTLEVIKKIPLLFSDEELTELPLKNFFFNIEYEGKVYFTGRRFLLIADTAVGESVEKNTLKVVLSYWIKPDFATLFPHLSVSGFLVNLISPGDDERFSNVWSASESMWKKPLSEWEKESSFLAHGLEATIHIVKGKSFENPGTGKVGAFINPLFYGKIQIALRGNLFFVYPKKEEHLGALLSECVSKARSTDVCDLVAMASFAREVELKRAASQLGHPIPLEKFKHEV